MYSVDLVKFNPGLALIEKKTRLSRKKHRLGLFCWTLKWGPFLSIRTAGGGSFYGVVRSTCVRKEREHVSLGSITVIVPYRKRKRKILGWCMERTTNWFWYYQRKRHFVSDTCPTFWSLRQLFLDFRLRRAQLHSELRLLRQGRCCYYLSLVSLQIAPLIDLS